MIFPTNDKEIRAYVLLQRICKAENRSPSPYSPENDMIERNIAEWKEEYYELLKEILKDKGYDKHSAD